MYQTSSASSSEFPTFHLLRSYRTVPPPILSSSSRLPVLTSPAPPCIQDLRPHTLRVGDDDDDDDDGNGDGDDDWLNEASPYLLLLLLPLLPLLPAVCRESAIIEAVLSLDRISIEAFASLLNEDADADDDDDDDDDEVVVVEAAAFDPILRKLDIFRLIREYKKYCRRIMKLYTCIIFRR
jgi:hypothetical protein